MFVVAGMPRCATTFLYHNLQRHPAIFCPYRKETNYFSVNYGRGIDWYRRLYRGIGPSQVGADVSPSYFLHDGAVQRMRAYRPTIAVVLGVRTPSEWALSLYSQLLTHVSRGPSFAQFIAGYPYPIAGRTVEVELGGGGVTSRLERYRSAFGDGLLLYDYALLARDSLAVLRGIERFVGLPGYFTERNVDNTIINAGNRRNVGAVTYILSREWLISTLGRLLPRRALQGMRRAFDKAGGRGERLSPRVYTPENVGIAREAFAEDDRKVAQMFVEFGLQLGTGEPFEADAG